MTKHKKELYEFRNLSSIFFFYLNEVSNFLSQKKDLLKIMSLH